MCQYNNSSRIVLFLEVRIIDLHQRGLYKSSKILNMKKLKDRWKDVEFTNTLQKEIESLHYKNTTDLRDVDLAGIHLGNKIKLLEHSSLYKSKLYNVDLSYSIIEVTAFESDWMLVNFIKAKFDRCLLDKSIIKHCNFNEAKLVFNADDTVFEDCSFIGAKVGVGTYGHEYGGRRTKFVNCDFTDAVFKNVEFRASKFTNCNFTNTRFISCDLRGMKLFDGILPIAEQFENMESPL